MYFLWGIYRVEYTTNIKITMSCCTYIELLTIYMEFNWRIEQLSHYAISPGDSQYMTIIPCFI